MGSTRVSSFFACIALTAVAVLTVERSQAAPPAGSIQVTATVRDFRKSHPDFNTTPAEGFSHVAGSMGHSAGADSRPVFTAGGFKVTDQWRQRDGHPIAPHMYRSDGTVQIVTPPSMQPSTSIDTWDSTAGPYGGPNVGPAPAIEVGAAMPPMPAPPDLGPSVGNIQYMTGTTVVNTSVHCSSVATMVDARIEIDGDVTIVCDGSFTISQKGVIVLRPGATLTIFTDQFKAFQDAMVNMNTWDPSRVVVYVAGSQMVDISQQSQVCATIFAPNAKLSMGQGDQLFGSFTGLTIDLKQSAQLHVDGIPQMCGVDVDDTVGLAGVAANGGITSSATFDEWFNDVPGVNLSRCHKMTFVNNGGIYEYIDNAFHPVDGGLYGNDGDAHNNHFTLMITASFVYEQCTGQFMEFEGNDSAWGFVDGKLALDVGGVGAVTRQYVDLDRFHLVDGQTYRLDFFYAQRQALPNVFKLRTNVPLITSAPAPVMTVAAD